MKFTKEQAKIKFIDALSDIKRYWLEEANKNDLTTEQLLHYTIRNVLTLIDGKHLDFPRLNLVNGEDDDDIEFYKENDIDYIDNKEPFNDEGLYLSFMFTNREE